MNAAYLHLILNHFPIVGTFFILLVLLIGIWFKNGALQKTALALFVLVALISVPVYLSGKGAEDIVEKFPGVNEEAIAVHERSAVITLLAIEVLGVICLLGFAFFGRREKLPARFLVAVVGWTLVAAALTAQTSSLGGKIRHPEETGGSLSAGSKVIGE